MRYELKIGLCLAALATIVVLPTMARAEEVDCRTKVTRNNLVPCALAASRSVQEQQKSLEAIQGRKISVSSILPSNPALAFSTARRGAKATEPTSINWYATLSQEIEIAGQRATRVKAVDAELTAQDKRIVLGKRKVALRAWTAFFEFAAAAQEQQLMARLLAASQRMATASRARADKGVGAIVEADVAEAATLKILQSKLAANSSLTSAQANLDLIFARSASEPPLIVEGDLSPLPVPDASLTSAERLANRPEVQLLDAERQANLRRADAYRRARIPNPTLSVFAQNDGYNEHVLGLGMAFPIPLPMPVGRTYAGEIAESEALAERSSIEGLRVEQELRFEIITAYAAYDSHRQLVDNITPDRIRRAEEALRQLASEIEAGRLAVRDALLIQQQLIDFLATNIAERRALSLASANLIHALGLPLR